MIKNLKPPPGENSLTYGQLVGYFREETQRSYESCSNKKISFDLPPADAIDFGQVFVILKRSYIEGGAVTLQDTPEIKIYGDKNEGRKVFDALFVFLFQIWKSSELQISNFSMLATASTLKR